MKIYYSPASSTSNKYVHLISEILKSKNEILSLPRGRSILKLLLERSNNKNSIVILNWFEDLTANSNNILMGLFWVIYLLFIRLSFRRIIWVRHNFKPHSRKNLFFYNLICSILSRICEVKIAHRPMKGYRYVPHPMYKNSQALELTNTPRDIEFLFFGSISRYKGLDKLLISWPKHKKLIIRGFCQDRNFYSEILNIIKCKSLDVDFVNDFIDDLALDDLLCRTKYVILPHQENSMIVSGSFYHAASFGANILMYDNEFYKYCKNKFKFVNLINSECEIQSPLEVYSSIEKECSDTIIGNELNRIITGNY